MLVVPGAVDVHCHVLDPTLTAVPGASARCYDLTEPADAEGG